MSVKSEDLRLDDRKDKIYSEVANILKLLGYSEEIVGLKRALICKGKLITWDFFEAVHSEQESDVSENRGYVIHTNERNIFIGYRNVTIGGYDCTNLVDLLNNSPDISALISKIGNIERNNRTNTGIPVTANDNVHNLLNV